MFDQSTIQYYELFNTNVNAVHAYAWPIMRRVGR